MPISTYRRYSAASALFFFALAVLAGCGGISDEELAARVAAAKPGWDDYEEDIKAMIGPAAVAEWEGEPARAWREDGTLRVQFRMSGPWAQRDIAIPILLRDPALNIHAPVSQVVEDQAVTYSFDLGGGSPRVIPWVEVAYPHHLRRIPVSEASASENISR